MSNIEVFNGDRATNYDNFVNVWIPCYNSFMSLLPNLLLADQNNSAQKKQILIAGCGTGNEIEALAKASPNWHLIGVDPSPEMILQAKHKLSHYPNVTLYEGVVADLEDLHKDNQFKDDQYNDSQPDNGQQTSTSRQQKNVKQYDAATLLLVLHFLKDNGDKLDLLKDIATRLKPNASLIILDINGDPNHIERNLLILEKLLPSNIDKKMVEFRLNRMQHSLHHVTEQRFIELCLEAGFKAPIRFFQSTVYMGWMLETA